MAIKLFNHQQRILERKPKRCLLAWGTGTGKTITSIHLALQNGRDFLVICPKALKEKWNREIQSVTQNSVYLILTKEEFKKQAPKLHAFTTVIVDEAHYFSGMKSQLSKSLISYLREKEIDYIYLLTATPFMSTPWNIYRLAQILGYDWSYISFLSKFFSQVRMGGRIVPVVRPHMEEEIAKLVHRIGDVVNLDECADVPDQIFEIEYFKTNKKQIEEMEAVALKETNPVVKYTKFHQIENGSLKGDEYNADKIIEADKHQRIFELVKENPKLAVFCRYNLQIDALEALLKAQNKKVFIIRGDVQNRDEVVTEAENCPNCVILINAACSEGYELPSFGVIVFASLSFSYKDYKQAQGRFLRINRLKKNVYIHLLNEDSVDEGVYKSISKKEDFDIAIYAKKRHSN